VLNLCKKWAIDIDCSGVTLQELSKESNNIEGNNIDGMLNNIRSIADQTYILGLMRQYKQLEQLSKNELVDEVNSNLMSIAGDTLFLLKQDQSLVSD
jgi:hypothetical protein